MRRWRSWPGSAIATLASLTGLLVAFAAVQAILGSGGNGAVAASPEFVVWAGLIAVGTCVYAQVFGRMIGPVRAWAGGADVALVWPTLVYVLVVTVTLSAVTGHGPADGLPTVYPVLWLAYLAAVVGAGPPVIGLWLIPVRLSRVAALDQHDPSAASAAVVEVVACRADLNRCLTGLSLIVSSAVLNTGALRVAQLAHGMADKEFPPALVLVYGGALAAVVALVYIPAFLVWRTQVDTLINSLYPVPGDGRPQPDWVSGRAALAGLLGSDATVGKSLGAAFGVFAPLLSGGLALFVPIAKL